MDDTVNFFEDTQATLFGSAIPVVRSADKLSVSSDESVDGFLRQEGCVVALSVSGGKDSSAMAVATTMHLRAMGFPGEIVLIHADLGEVEWKDSLPCCERLAEHLKLPLIVVRRKAGGMMQRWEQRWENNVGRYARLEAVKLILPWSTPSMRFCTSELKTKVIDSELNKRYRSRPLIQVTGVRRAESTARSKSPISKASSVRNHWLYWNSILDWSTPEVFRYLERTPALLHEAYTRYGSSRVSCAFCIMGSMPDLAASAACDDNAEIYRRMVDLEIASTFAFQGSRWLGDVAPGLLSETQKTSLARAKQGAERRVNAESWIPRHLLFEDGRPSCLPTLSEAELLADIRREVSTAVGIDIGFTTADAIVTRYEELSDVTE